MVVSKSTVFAVIDRFPPWPGVGPLVPLSMNTDAPLGSPVTVRLPVLMLTLQAFHEPEVCVSIAEKKNGASKSVLVTSMLPEEIFI